MGFEKSLPLLCGPFFVYLELLDCVTIVNLQTGESFRKQHGLINAVAMTENYLVVVQDGSKLFTHPVANLADDVEPVVSENDWAVYAIAADKHLLAVMYEAHNLIIYDLDQHTHRHIEMFHDPETSFVDNTRSLGLCEMVLDADRKALYRFSHCHGVRNGQRLHEVQVRRVRFDDETPQYHLCTIYYPVRQQIDVDSHKNMPIRVHVPSTGRPGEWYLQSRYVGRSYNLLLTVDEDAVTVRELSYTDNAAVWKGTYYVKDGPGNTDASESGDSAARGTVPLWPQFQPQSPLGHSELFVNESFLVDFTRGLHDNGSTFVAYTFDESATNCPVKPLLPGQRLQDSKSSDCDEGSVLKIADLNAGPVFKGTWEVPDEELFDTSEEDDAW